jgi:hypothetical protein
VEARSAAVVFAAFVVVAFHGLADLFYLYLGLAGSDQNAGVVPSDKDSVYRKDCLDSDRLQGAFAWESAFASVWDEVAWGTQKVAEDECCSCSSDAGVGNETPGEASCKVGGDHRVDEPEATYLVVVAAVASAAVVASAS